MNNTELDSAGKPLVWVKHDGGPMPVPGDTMIHAAWDDRISDGTQTWGDEKGLLAKNVYGWENKGHGDRITHYAIVTPPPSVASATSAIDAHYTKYAIQPMEFSLANGLDPAQHTVIKYVVRYRDKHGMRDLRAAIRVLELMIERADRDDG